ncbi:MAG: ABC transporter substrate-binding protein [Shimia sp.]
MKHSLLGGLCLALTNTTAVLAQDCAEGQRAFEHWEGAIECVRDVPKRIVTLQDQNALLPIMELGLVPVGSAGFALEDGGHSFRALQKYDTSMVTYVGPYWPGPDIEAVAALEPDLIIANPWIEGAYDPYSKIAPTVLMAPSEVPFREALFDFAELVGRTDRARELEAEFEAKAQELRAELGDKLTTTTVSLMSYWNSEMPSPPNKQSLGLAVPGFGMIRTEYQQTIDDWVAISPEILGTARADIMILIAAADAQIGDLTPAVENFMANPLVAATEVAREG